jgi:23S rRNA (cytidine2498-2'-O)-methyltransferase
LASPPRQEVPVDWLFSDSSCCPDRSLDLVRRWMKAAAARNFVCTLKFESETVHATAAEFEAIPGACLLRGDQNKHELTFAILRWGRCGTAAAVPLCRWWMPLLKRTASPIL